jgi:hypothetical protein
VPSSTPARPCPRTRQPGPSPPPAPHSAVEQELIGKLTRAYTAADLDSLVALLTDDVRLSMQPHPFEYRGRVVAP